MEEIIRGSEEVAEYRVILSESRGLPDISVEIETRAEPVDPIALAKNLQLRFETALIICVCLGKGGPEAGTLPRSEMKSNRWSRTASADHTFRHPDFVTQTSRGCHLQTRQVTVHLLWLGKAHRGDGVFPRLLGKGWTVG